jgi:hypothetical protein
VKVILSRKGFDKSAGGIASPIMRNGTLLSLPIPSSNDTEKFSKLKYGKKTYLEIIRELKPETKIKGGISLPTKEVNRLKVIMGESWNKFIKIRKLYGENGVKFENAWNIYEKAFDKYSNANTRLEKIYKEKGGDDCHLDPDLRKEVRPREKGWKPLFGQAGRSQTILSNNAISADDLFLFFGWFRRVQKNSKREFEYIKGEPDLHIIYGYLQVGEIFSMNEYTQ